MLLLLLLLLLSPGVILSFSFVIVVVSCCRCRLLLSNLEAFSVDNGWARFVVFLLGDPHLLEGGERSRDGSSDPDGVFPLWWCDDLDLHGGWGEGGDFLLHTVSDTGEHSGTTGEDDVGVQVLTDVNIA